MSQSSVRLLLVEDGAADALLLQYLLAEVREESFEVTHVETMADAVGRLAGEPFDAILLDLSLPDSRGVNTVAQINAAAPNLPIVVMTGLDDNDTGMQALRQARRTSSPKARSAAGFSAAPSATRWNASRRSGS